MFELNSSVGTVILQFSFSNPKNIPPSVKRLKFAYPEMPDEKIERKLMIPGNMVIQPTMKVSLEKFLDDLRHYSAFEMVGAFVQERITNPNNPDGYYSCVRYVFKKRGAVILSSRFKAARETLWAELKYLCRALWRVRVFLNPSMNGGRKQLLSINLEVRTPMLQSDGQPIMEYERDSEGRKVKAFPLGPEHHLRLTGNDIQFT